MKERSDFRRTMALGITIPGMVLGDSDFAVAGRRVVRREEIRIASFQSGL